MRRDSNPGIPQNETSWEPKDSQTREEKWAVEKD